MFLLDQPFVTRIQNFIETLIYGSDTEWFIYGLFSSWKMLFSAALDIFVSTLFIYFILKLFRESRAWQLFKGFLFIGAISLFFSSFGLTTISYILTKSISLLLIGVVVIFQPELRRALETLGRNSFNFFDLPLELNKAETSYENTFVEAIVMACEHMAATCTGALIVLERSTHLGEIIANSSTAVILDSLLTAPALEQIFYKNSPLHDGALIIRENRIYAARCHVPLSDSVQLDGKLGTRHRAALGVSELGDSIAIVVSEERGTISLAFEGKLMELKDHRELRQFLQLMYLSQDTETKQKFLSRLLQRFRQKGFSLSAYQEAEAEGNRRQSTYSKKGRLGLQVLSFGIAVFLYLYVQVNANPVETYVFNQLSISRERALEYEKEGYKISLETSLANVSIKARSNTLNELLEHADSLVTYVELPDFPLRTGNFSLPVKVESTVVSDNLFQVQSISPKRVLVSIKKEETKEERLLPGLKSNLEEVVEVLPSEEAK